MLSGLDRPDRLNARGRLLEISFPFDASSTDLGLDCIKHLAGVGHQIGFACPTTDIYLRWAERCAQQAEQSHAMNAMFLVEAGQDKRRWSKAAHAPPSPHDAS